MTTTISLCYQLVDVFSGICERKLWLKDAKDGQPKTNGYYIEVPFNHAQVYPYTEHEISHILFQSDGKARDLFLSEYVAKLAQVAKQNKRLINPKVLRKGLEAIVNILDDERVISLWSLLYEGSGRKLRSMKYEQAIEVYRKAHENLIVMFSVLAGGHYNIPEGRLDRFRPAMIEALRKVRYCDYYGCLVVAKWLIVQLVSEIIRESRDLPKLPGPTYLPGPHDDITGMTDPGVWEAPDVQATPDERAEALSAMVSRLGTPSSDQLEEVAGSTVEDPKMQASAALRTAVKDEKKLQKALKNSSVVMHGQVEKARQATKNTPQHDDHVRRDAFAKVVFKDITPSPHSDPHAELPEQDAALVRRLRAIFHRVMGKRTNVLEDTGTQIDIPAYLEYRLTGVSLPVYRVDRNGRGFRSMILIDRSTSMAGARTKKAERACRIISRALDFPFVKRTVWGFQSWEQGVVDITRFLPGREVFESDSAIVGGVTPLHSALRVAIRELEDNNTDRKHLFVISDGFPVFANSDGEAFGTGTLMAFIKHNVMYARTKGIGVTGVVVGQDLTEYGMRYMFGSSDHWRVMKTATFDADLIDLISSTFTKYLRST